jgi:SH3 domain-containing protein
MVISLPTASKMIYVCIPVRKHTAVSFFSAVPSYGVIQQMKDVRLARGKHGSTLGSHRSTIAPRSWAWVWLLSSALSGCVTPPAPPAVPPEATVREPACPSCEEQTRAIARLRQDLANRDAELRELRSNQRDQVKVLQESTREVARAKVKLRRLATQADAASYVAEVEVAMESLRSSLGATSNVQLVVLAQGILDSTAAPFAQGDYGEAMDRAAQAEQLIALVAHYQVRPGSRPRVPGEVPLQVAIPLKVTVDSNLRRQPLGKAPVVRVLKKDSLLVAHAYKGNWMQVETEDGRSGWVDQTRLGAR